MSKTLSVIIPSYNMEAYLPKCLGGLIIDDKDMMQNLEVIVVNDGSKDRTSEIAHEFEAKWPEVFRVIDKANANYGSCINAALKVASGAFVKILDADDTYDNARFCEFMAFAANLDDSVDVILTPFVQVDCSDVVVKETRYECPKGQVFAREVFNDTVGWAYMHSVAYRTDLLREISYKQTEGISYTDTEWVFLPIAAAKRFVYVEIPVYRYLVGREGQTVSREATLKSFGSYKTLLSAMCALYRNVKRSDGDLNFVSLAVSMKRIALLIYTIVALDLRIGKALTEFDIVDSLLHEYCPDLYNAFDEARFSRTFQWRYVMFLRRHSKMRYCYIIMLRLYSAILGVVKWRITR